MTVNAFYFLVIMGIYLGAFLLYSRQRMAWGNVLMIMGILGNVAFLFQHACVGEILVGNALVDPPFFIPLIIAVALLLIPEIKAVSKLSLGLSFALLMAVIFFAFLYPKGVIPPAPNKSGLWPFLFFLFENTAYAIFGLSLVLSIVLKDRIVLSKAIRRFIVLGFISFSIAQVVGAIWAFLGWGHPFMWGPRHLSSATVWLIYAAVIHMRFISSFIIPERWLVIWGGLLSLYIVYSHLIFEMGIPRVGGGL
jgi:ABC-type transport system involved in cytochrome c biogenesis permease subunit